MNSQVSARALPRIECEVTEFGRPSRRSTLSWRSGAARSTHDSPRSPKSWKGRAPSDPCSTVPPHQRPFVARKFQCMEEFGQEHRGESSVARAEPRPQALQLQLLLEKTASLLYPSRFSHLQPSAAGALSAIDGAAESSGRPYSPTRHIRRAFYQPKSAAVRRGDGIAGGWLPPPRRFCLLRLLSGTRLLRCSAFPLPGPPRVSCPIRPGSS